MSNPADMHCLGHIRRKMLKSQVEAFEADASTRNKAAAIVRDTSSIRKCADTAIL